MKEEDEIAIVGIGCRFPGADNVDGFWRVLSKGENHVKEIPKDRWDLEDVYDKDPDAPLKTNVRHAGFVKNYHEWDHKFFGISEMEAGDIDPQQRMVLDCVHMALEDGGIRRQDIDGSYTGVYIGSMNDDFKAQAMISPKAFGSYTVTGLHNSIISARVAYVYNLHGPSVTLDTACSSSLVAINIAEQALRLGTCDAAICGGVNSIMDAVQFVALTKTRMLSPTGQSKPFSADADGYARGEGCGIVILKLLKEAIRDGNKIWGTLKSGTNQDGNTAKPITAPSLSMQLDLLNRLYEMSKVDKHTVQVIEAHGTGTPVGDPIETNALGKFFGKARGSNQKIPIGSVKSNIGHTEAAAGVAGLTKVLLMMKYGQVVPSLLLDKANINPKINFDQYGFEVPTEIRPWKRPSNGGRIACVNSFGFGGTNSHAVVHEYVKTPNIRTVKEKQRNLIPYFITLSALDESSVVDQVRDLTQKLKVQDYDLQSLSYTSIYRRDHRFYRKAFVAENQQELIESCERYIEAPTKLSRFHSKPEVVFVFCGVGTTWQRMCSFMMRLDAFRNAIKAIDLHLLPLSGWALSSKLSSTCDMTADPLVSHVAIFGCQVGLVEVWKSFGITPDLVVGQSVGEVAAAYTSGSIDLKSAVRVIYYRSKFLSEVKNGAMAVVKNVDTNKIEEICATTKGKLSIAVYNSPTSCTISGEKAAIDLVRTKLTNGFGGQGGLLIDLDVPCAYHSPYVETAAKKATQMLKNLTPGKHSMPIISTVSGRREQHQTFARESYWEKNTRCAVRFGEAILHAVKPSDSQPTVFIEIGPGPVLGAHVKSLFKSQHSQVVLPSMRKENAKLTLCKTICTLYELGLHPNWEQLICRSETITDIPRYVFRKQSTPYNTKQILANASASAKEVPEHLYINRNTTTFQVQVNETSTPFVFDHVVRGSVLVPGAFYAEVGFEAAQAVLGISSHEAVVFLEFTKTAKIEQGTRNLLSVDLVETNEKVKFFVKQKKRLVCTGKVEKKKYDDCHSPHNEKNSGVACLLDTNHNIENEFNGRKFDIQILRLSMMEDLKYRMESAAIYEQLSEMGFQYGDCFQILNECLVKEGHCLGTFSIPGDVFKDIGRTTVHPCILDGMFQSTFLATDEKAAEVVIQEQLLLMPVAIQSITVYDKPKTKTVYSYATMANASILPSVLKIHYDIVLLNSDGTIIVDVRNYTTYCRRSTKFTPDELKYQLTWSPVSLKPAINGDLKLLVINMSEHEERRLDIASDNTAVCNLPNQLTEEMLPDIVESTVKKKWGTLDKVEATVLLFCKDENQLVIDVKARDRIYATAKQNCMIITWILRFYLRRKQTPLFIITENTQAVAGTEKKNVNFTGSEVWGFIRNVLIEFVHDKVVLLDLQPSLEETKSTLVKFLSSAVQNIELTQTEYVISGNKLLGATFSKTAMTEKMPNMRPSVNRHLKANCMVMSEQGNGVVRPYICPLPDKRQILRAHKGFVEIEPTSVSLHNDTMSSELLSNPLHDDVTRRHAIFAVEYTGFEIKPKSQLFRCGNNSVAAEEIASSDRWQVVAVYPQQITTRMSVPRDCLVSLRELPFYTPNMLSHSILFWHITCSIPKGAKVQILPELTCDEYSWVLERMLRSVASATVADRTASSSADVLVVICNYSEGMLDNVKCAKTVVCLKYAIPETVQKYLRENRDITIVELDSWVVWKRNEVSKTLKKIVAWLKRNISVKDMDCMQITSDNSVCISNNGLHGLPLKLPFESQFEENDVFVITGGITGLGWQTILMLVEKGVGTVATMSRREVDDETKKAIEDTEIKYDCGILCYRGDVCDLHAVKGMIGDLTTKYGSDRIRGVVHGAGVLDSQLLINMEESHLDRVMSPKVLGVLNLHMATEHLNLDFFIVQSSISSIAGMPGQGNYGAANVFLDAFARWRRNRGLAAQSINWGSLEVGMAAQTHFLTNLVKRGYNVLSIAELQDCFFHAIMQNSTEVVYANLDWSIIARDFASPSMARVLVSMKDVLRLKNVEHLLQQNQSWDEEFSLEKFKDADNATKQRGIEKLIVGVARRTIESDFGILKMTSTFAELGMQSLDALNFSNVVHQETRYRIAQETLPEKSLDEIVAEVCLNVFGFDTVKSMS